MTHVLDLLVLLFLNALYHPEVLVTLFHMLLELTPTTYLLLLCFPIPIQALTNLA